MLRWEKTLLVEKYPPCLVYVDPSPTPPRLLSRVQTRPRSPPIIQQSKLSFQSLSAIGPIGEKDEDDKNNDSEYIKGLTAEEDQEVEEITNDEEIYSKPRRGSAIYVKSEKPKQKEQPHKAKKHQNPHQRKFLPVHLPLSHFQTSHLRNLLLLKFHIARLKAISGRVVEQI
ncbi:MAG: hypothetical protein EZS28_015502 [Streblomastix strix]|uniref:Uncharacterized protein n=1 Tax=Streblomastix strix TaxID=222440 RepID=A0A5J4W368_9EUKA|nr:MAG: hypothetical protein EZS28_015502 [Streblomastix strix]